MSLPRLLAILLLLASLASASEPNRVLGEHPAMGTICRIAVYDHSHANSQATIVAAFREIDALEALLSDYRPESEISQLPKRSGDADPQHEPRPIAIDPRTAEILRCSQIFSEQTQGAFDVTAGRLTQLWRSARRQKVLPTAAEIESARAHVGWQKLVVDQQLPQCQLKDNNMSLDLGGIAKGFAVDSALKVLREGGIETALVSLGGDLAIGKPGGKARGYRVAISPHGMNSEPLATLWLHDVGVSTSGAAEQSWQVNNHHYSHILDPRTGWPVHESWSVSVIASSAILADGLATALAVVGPVAGLEWLQRDHPQVDALFVRSGSVAGGESEQEGLESIVMTRGMVNRLLDAREVVDVADGLRTAALSHRKKCDTADFAPP